MDEWMALCMQCASSTTVVLLSGTIFNEQRTNAVDE